MYLTHRWEPYQALPLWDGVCCIHTDAVKNDEWRTLLDKYLPLNLFTKFERVVWGSTVRGSWRPIRNCNILTPLLWPSALCLSGSPDAQPEAQRPILLGDGFLYCILSASSLDPKSIEGPEPHWPGVAFLTASRL